MGSDYFYCIKPVDEAFIINGVDNYGDFFTMSVSRETLQAFRAEIDKVLPNG